MHQIQKQIIEIDLPDGSDAFSWQEKITTICNDSLTEKLGILFDRMGFENTLSFDKIEIDLGLIDANDFEKLFLQNIENQLLIKIKSIFEEEGFDDLQSKKQVSFNTKNDQSNYEAFIYFLEKGTLQWWVSNDFLEEIEQNIVVVFSESKTQKHAQITHLKKVFESEKVVKRFVLQFSEKIFWAFVRIVFFEENEVISFYEKVADVIQNTFLKFFKKEDFDVVKVSVFAVFLENIVQSKLLIVSDLYEKILALISQESFAEKSIILNFQRSFKIALKESLKVEIPKQDFELIEEEAFFEKGEKGIEAKTVLKEFSEKEEKIEDGFYIENAGLVLLFPFLKEYLKSCEVADNEQIFEPDNAVHLLQYLVNFQTKTFENHLVLNKILCGLPLNFPIKKGFEINENQIKQAEMLLESVIKYWSVMHNTSKEGLQLSFLQRNGKLSKNTDGWLLQVEQAPYDMLLDELPWTYSVVSMPWMKEMIFVEWS